MRLTFEQALADTKQMLDAIAAKKPVWSLNTPDQEDDGDGTACDDTESREAWAWQQGREARAFNKRGAR
jgi:hypothetical protein